MPFKMFEAGVRQFRANGKHGKPGQHILVAVARYLAAALSNRARLAAKQPTSQLGYQEATSFMRTSRRRVHDAMLRRRRGAALFLERKTAKIFCQHPTSACIPEWGGLWH